MDAKDMQAAARWIIAHDARDAKETVRILGISRARLSQLMSEGEIKGRIWSGRVWVPMREITKHIIQPGEVRIGRPRSGATR